MKFNIYSIPKCLKLVSAVTIFVILSSLVSNPVNVNGQSEDELTQGPEICDNGVDDDGDEFTDGEDSDCSLMSGEGKQEQQTSEDEQQQDQKAVEEQQQKQEPNEVPTVEICDNGLDDDGDGLVDNQDGDCPPLSSEPEQQDVDKQPQDEKGQSSEHKEQVAPTGGEQSIESGAVEVCNNGVGMSYSRKT
jgi:hypothetical protein